MAARRPFLIRLLAIAFVLAGATGTGVSAPQALRAFHAAAAEVAAAPRAFEQRHTRPAAPVRPIRAAVCRPIACPIRRVRRLESSAWPTACDAREILALKRARLL